MTRMHDIDKVQRKANTRVIIIEFRIVNGFLCFRSRSLPSGATFGNGGRFIYLFRFIFSRARVLRGGGRSS